MIVFGHTAFLMGNWLDGDRPSRISVDDTPIFVRSVRTLRGNPEQNPFRAPLDNPVKGETRARANEH